VVGERVEETGGPVVGALILCLLQFVPETLGELWQMLGLYSQLLAQILSELPIGLKSQLSMRFDA
jgi:hypothetical protein